MKTQKEKDSELIASFTRMIASCRPSFVRLFLFSTLSCAIGAYQLSVQQEVVSGIATILFFLVGSFAAIESSRFGYCYDRVNGGIKSTTLIVICFIVIFLAHRLFDYLHLTPTHRRLGWILLLWCGLTIGVLASQASKDKE